MKKISNYLIKHHFLMNSMCSSCQLLNMEPRKAWSTKNKRENMAVLFTFLGVRTKQRKSKRKPTFFCKIIKKSNKNKSNKHKTYCNINHVKFADTPCNCKLFKPLYKPMSAFRISMVVWW